MSPDVNGRRRREEEENGILHQSRRERERENEGEREGRIKGERRTRRKKEEEDDSDGVQGQRGERHLETQRAERERGSTSGLWACVPVHVSQCVYVCVWVIS